MRLIIQESYSQLSQWAAAYIVKRINEFAPTAEKPFVLGLVHTNSSSNCIMREKSHLRML